MNEIGMKVYYDSNNRLKQVIHCLLALAMVPSSGVIEILLKLADNMLGLRKMPALLYSEHP
jgi:hypothetical protein